MHCYNITTLHFFFGVFCYVWDNFWWLKVRKVTNDHTTTNRLRLRIHGCDFESDTLTFNMCWVGVVSSKYTKESGLSYLDFLLTSNFQIKLWCYGEHWPVILLTLSITNNSYAIFVLPQINRMCIPINKVIYYKLLFGNVQNIQLVLFHLILF